MKEGVYRPDWRSPERVRYTQRLTDLLARWLPEGRPGSISTVPLGFRASLSPEDLPLVKRNLADALKHVERLGGCRFVPLWERMGRRVGRRMGRALLVIDMLADFVEPWGALGAGHGEDPSPGRGGDR